MRRYLLSLGLLTLCLFFAVGKAEAIGTCQNFSNPPGPPPPACSECHNGIGPPSNPNCNINDYDTEDEPNVGGCNACVGIEPGTGYYLYAYYGSDATISSTSCGRHEWGGGSGIGYPGPQQSNVQGCYWGASLPAACNHAYDTTYCEAGGGGSGGGGGQCQEESGGGSCPVAYRNRNCSDVPCSYRIDCDCTCGCDSQCETGGSGQCQDAPGGGPTATPTPTPTPYCTLSCPGGGSGGTGGTGTGGSGLGTGSGDSSGPTIVPPYASGSIAYNGYNGFSCSTFDNGQTGVGSCPSSGGGGSGGLGGGGSESWSQAAKFNMLCGEQPLTYTAEVSGASSGGSGTGSGGAGTGGATSTPVPGTPTPTPTQSLYPQGCTIGLSPTPDPGGGQSAGAGGGSSGSSLSCSCSVTLGCQASREAPPSDPSQQSGTCNAGVCDFTVDPEMAAFNNELTFAIDHADAMNQNTLDFDDLSDNASLGASTSTTHTYVNAGVYDVTLTCSNGSSSIDCTRRVNAYCDNGVAPTLAPTAVPTGLSWFKVKNGAFDRRASLLNTIPSSASSYDSDDDGICALSGPQLYSCMLSGSAGTLRSSSSITLGEGTSSAPAWQKADTTISTRFTPTNYLAYVRARKKVTTITSLSQISSKGIYIYEGNLSMASSDISSTEDFVLVVHGDLTITDSLNSLQNLSAAVIATGTLNISEQVSTLYGIFAASTVDFSSDASSTTTPLKIVGNLMTTTSTDTYNERLRSDGNKPSVFVVVDYHRYSDLLDLLSTRYYEQQEIVE